MRNPYEDNALAALAVDLLIKSVSRPESIGRIQSFLSDSLFSKINEMPEAEALRFLQQMILRDGMAPNPSSIKTRWDLDRDGESSFCTVAYYDRDIRPGVNHENVRVIMLFENGAWHVDRWIRDGEGDSDR